MQLCNVPGQRGGNMLYLLLPFFVAVSSPVRNDDWKYGPEYKFSGHLRMITLMERDKGGLMGNKLIFDLRCQPRMSETLVCRFGESSIARIKPRGYDASRTDEESEEFKKTGLMNKMFAVKFNEKGIDGYVIEKTKPPLPAWCLDMTRLIFNQLSIGASIADEYTPKFRTSENFTFGECDVVYTITRKPPGHRENVNRSYELAALENLGEFHDESIEIEKKRDVHDCLVCTDYFYGSRYTYGIVLRDVLTKLISSTSRLFVSKNELRAETVNEVELFGEDRKYQGKVLDHIMIRLDSVSPATEEFMPLKNPVVMEVVANRPGNPHVQ